MPGEAGRLCGYRRSVSQPTPLRLWSAGGHRHQLRCLRDTSHLSLPRENLPETCMALRWLIALFFYLILAFFEQISWLLTLWVMKI